MASGGTADSAGINQPLAPLLECPFDACARPEAAAAAAASTSYADVGPYPLQPGQLPMVYSDKYNIRFFGIEKLHPFDSCKFQKVVRALGAAGVLSPAQLVAPLEAGRALLEEVHTAEYLDTLHSSNLKIVQVTELPALLLLPTWLLRRKVLRPMAHHAAGTVLAAGLALQRGWAINLGGGMHHAHRDNGMGWCPFDDIMLAVLRLRRASGGRIQRVMVVDCDAHQGNGLGRDKLHFKDDNLFIVDLYNASVFPHDDFAKAAIDVPVELRHRTRTSDYLAALGGALAQAEQRCRPDFIFYNAGTDVLAGDALGCMGVSNDGVIERDSMVFEFALKMKAPICMTLSGGYTPQSAVTIAASITHLFKTFDLGRAANGSH